jgi:hypothetical protein
MGERDKMHVALDRVLDELARADLTEHRVG